MGQSYSNCTHLKIMVVLECVDYKVTINKFIQHRLILIILTIGVNNKSKRIFNNKCIKKFIQIYKIKIRSSNCNSYFSIFYVSAVIIVKNVFCYINDILIGEKRIEKCKQKLELVLDTKNKFNISILWINVIFLKKRLII